MAWRVSSDGEHRRYVLAGIHRGRGVSRYGACRVLVAEDSDSTVLCEYRARGSKREGCGARRVIEGK